MTNYAMPTAPVRTATSGFAIASLVCAIVGIFLFDVILGPLAVIFGAIALGQARQGAGGRGMAIAGVVIGILDVLLFVVVLAVATHSHGFQWHV